MSRIRLPDYSKLATNLKYNNDIKICWPGVIVNFFNVFLFVLSILVTCPCLMSLLLLAMELWQFLFIRDWPEIPRLSFRISGGLELVTDTKFGRNISNEKLHNDTRSPVYSFYRFWVFKGKSTGCKSTSQTSRLGLRLMEQWKSVLGNKIVQLINFPCK